MSSFLQNTHVSSPIVLNNMNLLPHTPFFFFCLPRVAAICIGRQQCRSYLLEMVDTALVVGPHFAVCTSRKLLLCYRENQSWAGNFSSQSPLQFVGFFSSQIQATFTSRYWCLFFSLKAFFLSKQQQKKSKSEVWGKRNPSSAELCPKMGKVPETPLSLLCYSYWFYVEGSQILWGWTIV